MDNSKWTPSKMQAEADKMIKDGTMPPLKDVLKAMAEVRQEFVPKIMAARKADDVQQKGSAALGGDDPQNKSKMEIEPLPQKKPDYALPIDQTEKPLTKT